MRQYELMVKNSTKLIKDIYERFLVNDKSWHFFYEVDYMLIRLEKYNSSMEKFLRKRKIKFKVTDVWVDAHPEVRKKQDIFKELFHQFSVLGMICKSKDFDEVAERVFHCYLNMNGHFLQRKKISESLCLARHAVSRAQSEGYYWGMQKKGR